MARRPGQLKSEGRKQVVKRPCQDDVVVHIAEENDDGWSQANTFKEKQQMKNISALKKTWSTRKFFKI